MRHDNSGKSVQPAWMDPDRDVVHIAATLLALRTTAEGLISTFHSLAGIVGTRDSLKEAHSVQALTKLGMIILPLSLVQTSLVCLELMSRVDSTFGLILRSQFHAFFSHSEVRGYDGWQKLGLIIAAIGIKRHASEHRDLIQA
jgi:hypothetical protein